MRAAVRGVWTIEGEPLTDVSADDPTSVSVWIRVLAGPTGERGEESFDLEVCTASRAPEVMAPRPVFERHRLVVEEWDPVRIDALIRAEFESIDAPSWSELGERLGQLAVWEFDGMNDDDDEGPRYTCPVCGYAELFAPPYTDGGGPSYEICWSCGFEFGVTDDDEDHTFESYRAEWIRRGMPWDSAALRPPPEGWNPRVQLNAVLGD